MIIKTVKFQLWSSSSSRIFIHSFIYIHKKNVKLMTWDHQQQQKTMMTRLLLWHFDHLDFFSRFDSFSLSISTIESNVLEGHCPKKSSDVYVRVRVRFRSMIFRDWSVISKRKNQFAIVVALFKNWWCFFLVYKHSKTTIIMEKKNSQV